MSLKKLCRYLGRRGGKKPDQSLTAARQEEDQGALLESETSFTTMTEKFSSFPLPFNGTSSKEGKHHSNEDCVVPLLQLNRFERNLSDDFYYSAVFDGHKGSECSLYLSCHLHLIIGKLLCKRSVTNLEDVMTCSSILSESFLICDNSFRIAFPNSTAGSCAIVSLIYESTILIAWCGDCRATFTIGTTVRQLSRDHRITFKEERDRVLSQGGYFLYDRLGGIIIPTRSFGDFDLKLSYLPKDVLIANPSICRLNMNENFEKKYQNHEQYCILILASDGLWDVLSNEQVSEFILKEAAKVSNSLVNFQEVAEKLVKHASKFTEDDVTCSLIIWNFKHHHQKEDEERHQKNSEELEFLKSSTF